MELIGDNVMIEPVQGDDITPGGIIIPDVAVMKPTRGKVVAVGIGRLLKNGTRLAPQVKVGDTVLYGERKLYPVEVDGRKYIVVPEDCILGILEREA